MQPMSAKTLLYRRLALGGYLALLAWVVLWHFVLIGDSPYSVTFLVLIYVLPLILPGHGIILGKPYTHAWASFIVLLYLMHGFTAIYTHPDQWLFALIEIVLASVMFTGCAMYARLRGQELGMGLKKLKDVMAEEKERFEGK